MARHSFAANDARSAKKLTCFDHKILLQPGAVGHSRQSPLAGSTVLFSHLLLVRLGALGLLRRRRLTLHLPLRILRRGRNIARCTIHRAGWRMFLVGSHASCRLAAANRCGSGTRVLQVCGSAACVAGAGDCAADTQDDRWSNPQE